MLSFNNMFQDSSTFNSFAKDILTRIINILDRKWYNRSCYGEVPMRRAHTLTLVAKETIIPLTYEDDTFSDVEIDEEIEAALGNPVNPKFRVEVKREMYAIGGASINRKGQELSIPDLWILNLDTYEWRKQPTSGKAPARVNHTTTNIKNKLYVCQTPKI